MTKYILNHQDRALVDILRTYSQEAADIFLRQWEDCCFPDDCIEWRERLEATVSFNEDPPVRTRSFILH